MARRNRLDGPLAVDEETRAYQVGALIQQMHIAQGPTTAIPLDWPLQGDWPGGQTGPLAELVRTMVRPNGEVGAEAWQEVCAHVADGYLDKEWPSRWHFDGHNGTVRRGVDPRDRQN